MKKSESGRSMVEMLGVLAIIGVLSVGGIAGYSLGMRKHRANQIADTVSKFAFVSYNECQKKILDGTLSDVETCAAYAKNFKNSDIGNLPAGVTDILPPMIRHDASTGNDILELSVHFDDDTLCKSYGTVVGAECDSLHGTPIVVQTIKQN